MSKVFAIITTLDAKGEVAEKHHVDSMFDLDKQIEFAVFSAEEDDSIVVTIVNSRARLLFLATATKQDIKRETQDVLRDAERDRVSFIA